MMPSVCAARHTLIRQQIDCALNESDNQVDFDKRLTRIEFEQHEQCQLSETVNTTVLANENGKHNGARQRKR